MTSKEKKQTKKIIHGMLLDKLVKVIDETANYEFIEKVNRKVKKELKYDFNKKDELELLNDLCYEVIRPLHIKLLQFAIGDDKVKI